MNNKDGFTCRAKNLELLSHRSNLKKVYIFEAVGFYHQPCSANKTARLTEESPMLISYNPSGNCKFAYLNSVLKWKFQCAIYQGTLFLFETPIQSYHWFLRKFFSWRNSSVLVSHKFCVNENQLDQLKQTFGCPQKENFGQISCKILSCIALARVVFLGICQ